MKWRVAIALEVLRQQLNAAFPRRSKISDGGIGDAKHASRNSDHNPWVKDSKGIGVVTARDFTHDPRTGIDCHWLADQLVKSRDPRIKYIIWNKRILSSKTAPWTWRPYSGVNAHTKHLHISVNPEPVHYDGTAKWKLEFPDDDDSDVAKVTDSNDILELDSAAAPKAHSGEERKATAISSANQPTVPPPTDRPDEVEIPIEQTQPSVTNTVVEQITTEIKPEKEVVTTTTAATVAAPVEVVKETPSLFAKLGAGITALTGIGINAGSLIQSKLENMTIQQIIYLSLALGLVVLAIYWYTKAAKAAQNRTMQLVEKAADPASTTVILK